GAVRVERFAAVGIRERIVEPVECLERQFETPARNAVAVATSEFLRDVHKLFPSKRWVLRVKASLHECIFVVVHDRCGSLERHAVDLTVVNAVEQHGRPEPVEELLAARRRDKVIEWLCGAERAEYWDRADLGDRKIR